MSQSPDDLANLTPDRRRREIAAILARGVLRLHCMRVDPTSGPADADSDPDESSLEVSAAPRPHVTGS